MTDLNNVTVIGRLTRDIEGNDFGYINNGTPKLSFSVAVNRSVKHGEEWTDDVSFFDITYWGKPAEAIKAYLGKGKQVAISGYLKQDRWKDNSGNNKTRVSIIAESVQLLGGKTEGNSNQNGSYSNNGSQKKTFTPREQSNQQQSFNTEEFPDDIPF